MARYEDATALIPYRGAQFSFDEFGPGGLGSWSAHGVVDGVGQRLVILRRVVQAAIPHCQRFLIVRGRFRFQFSNGGTSGSLTF